MPPVKLLINLMKKGLGKAPKKIPYKGWLKKEAKPALISSKPRGSQLFLEFDNRLGSVPNQKMIKEYAQSLGFDADVIKFKGGLKGELTLGGVRDTTRYRLDVWKGGRASGEAATDLSKMFGGEFGTMPSKLMGTSPKEIPYRQMLEGKKPILPLINPSLEKRIIYGGVQKDIKGLPAYHIITDKATKSTFMTPFKEDINLEIMKNLQRLEDLYRKANKPSTPIRLITKPEKDFYKKFQSNLLQRAEKVREKVESYPDWKWSPGEKIESFRTGRRYEITGRLWNMKKNKPLYKYKDIFGDESGSFDALKAHDQFKTLK